MLLKDAVKLPEADDSFGEKQTIGTRRFFTRFAANRSNKCRESGAKDGGRKVPAERNTASRTPHSVRDFVRRRDETTWRRWKASDESRSSWKEGGRVVVYQQKAWIRGERAWPLQYSSCTTKKQATGCLAAASKARNTAAAAAVVAQFFPTADR